MQAAEPHDIQHELKLTSYITEQQAYNLIKTLSYEIIIHYHAYENLEWSLIKSRAANNRD